MTTPCERLMGVPSTRGGVLPLIDHHLALHLPVTGPGAPPALRPA